ncbi:hypothetical protein [Halobaculum limi]|nr:hypothetical protein [Halobaculum sp. YSMS11]
MAGASRATEATSDHGRTTLETLTATTAAFQFIAVLAAGPSR